MKLRKEINYLDNILIQHLALKLYFYQRSWLDKINEIQGLGIGTLVLNLESF